MLHKIKEIVFATDFSDSSHAVIPSVAQWVDTLGAKLTLLHVYNPSKATYREAEAQLQSFFAEADNYPHCERVLISGDPTEGIATFCERRRNILLMLPPSDLTGLPRPWHRSMRARLIKRLSVPIWTLGRVNVGESTTAAHRHIGVWLGDPEEGLSHLQQAAHYASETGSTLHLLHVVDEINEGSLIKPLTSAGPMGEEAADAWLQEIADTLNPSCRVEVHVAQGRVSRELPNLIRRSGANLLMVSHQGAVQSGWMGPAINPIFGRCAISLVSVPYTGRFEKLVHGEEVAEVAA
ncbi:MAG: universal stress protein [Edaphobacter sp.]|uniref:universal stress protein n=1 Tax=Edaphobacter sp. TaxID=1934404 RepID=UPI002387C4F3|nr:universal stress protein [Edaphobacter sp.]MDE1176542.1 universal stress protein [Edaphobacter sp.]